MSTPDSPVPPDPKTSARPSSPESFEESASEPQIGLVREFLQFLIENKAWWLVPIILALLLLGAVIALSGSGMAPFIYPLF